MFPWKPGFSAAFDLGFSSGDNSRITIELSTDASEPVKLFIFCCIKSRVVGTWLNNHQLPD